MISIEPPFFSRDTAVMLCSQRTELPKPAFLDGALTIVKNCIARRPKSSWTFRSVLLALHFGLVKSCSNPFNPCELVKGTWDKKNCSMFQRCNFQNSFNYRMLWLFHVKIWTSRLARNSTFDRPSSPSSSPAASCRWLKGLMPKCWVSTCTSGENTATTMHGKYSQVTQLWANFFATNQKPNNRVAWVSLPSPIKIRGRSFELKLASQFGSSENNMSNINIL